MDVAVIIPAINEESRVGDAVSSAFAAGASDVILADGGSQDETVAVAVRAGARVVATHAGRAIQQNRGASGCQADVLLFLHADCRLGESCCEQVRKSLQDSRVAGGSFRQSINAGGLRFRWLEWGNAWRAGFRQCPYGDQGLFVRRTVFEEIGGFEEVDLLEDLLLARAIKRQGRLCLLEGPLHVDARRWESRGVLRQTLRNWWLLAAWRLGVPPNRLARYYRRHDQ